MTKALFKGLAASVDALFGRWASFSNRFYLPVLLITLAAAAVSGWNAKKLDLESDFEAMLPENYQSVRDLRHYQSQVGSTSILSVGLMTKDMKAARKFADDLAAHLQTDLKDKVHYVEYNIGDVREFFRKNALLYVDAEELEDKYRELNDYIGRRKLESTGLLVDLGEEEDERESEDDRPPLELEKLIREYNKKAADSYGTREDGYYINEAEDLLAMSIYPRPGHTGVQNARTFIADVDRAIKSLKPETYAPDLTYGFAGPVQVSLDEYTAIKKDIVSTISICVGLVMLVLLIYFLRIRQLVLIGAILGIGITITMGITRSAIGYLNAQTAFLGSIIVGTGINYSIILLARYTEERRSGLDPVASLKKAMILTWRATLSAAVTTAVAFGTLGLSENLSFKQFGFIASSGIVIIWLVTMLSLPSMLVLSEKIRPMVKKGKKAFEIAFIPERIARLIVSHPVAIVVASAAAAVLSAYFIVKWLPDALEYDFRNLRNKMTFQSGTEALDDRIVHECTHQSTSPLAVVTESLDEAEQYCRSIAKKHEMDPEKYSVGVCRTLKTFLPEDQEKKTAVLRKTDELLKRNRKLLPKSYRTEYDKYGEMLQARPTTVMDLPDTIRKKFRNIDGKEGVVAMVTPGAGRSIWVYENLTRFVRTATNVEIEKGRKLSATGGPIIMHDLVRTVAHDAPRDTLYAIVGVFIILLIIVGKARYAASLTVTLVVAIAAMVGIIA
ncbi:MAG: MMPL family transporter, partial [Pseudomonadota bacterium]